MSCTSPLLAYRLDSGEIKFGVKSGQGDPLTLPCGQCMSCRLERSRQWAVRCVHESRMHDSNCFLTLTYDDDHLPENSVLKHSDFQRFFKRLRKHFDPVRVRYYMCGEYGETNKRPHYHVCLFGADFTDRVPFRKSEAGFMVFDSLLLSRLWGMGNAWVGDLTFESAAYCSRYITTKLLGNVAKNPPQYVNSVTGEIFTRIPEYTRMSLKPGIGRPFYERYLTDIFPHDRVVVRGVVQRPPRYYSRMYSKSHPDEWEDIQFKRLSLVDQAESEFDRLEARDICTRARLGRFARRNSDL